MARASLTATVLLVLLTVCVAPVAAQDDRTARRAAAERYIAVADLDSMWNGTIAELAKTLPSEHQRPFVAYMEQMIDTTRMRGMLAQSMIDTFTVTELNALADFYGSPAGKSIMKKFPVYMAAIMPAIQKEILATARGYKL